MSAVSLFAVFMAHRGPSAAEICLADEDREVLALWSRGSSRRAVRARIVLACAEPGAANARVASDLGVSRPTVAQWRSGAVAAAVRAGGPCRAGGRGTPGAPQGGPGADAGGTGAAGAVGAAREERAGAGAACQVRRRRPVQQQRPRHLEPHPASSTYVQL